MSDPTRTPSPEQISHFRDLMGAARESRAEANTSAGEARETLKGLGFSAAAIAIFKRLTDAGQETAEATFSELCQLLKADPDFDLEAAQPDLFASAQVAEIKRSRKQASSGIEAGHA